MSTKEEKEKARLTMTNPQASYDIGYTAGQRLYERDPNIQTRKDLREAANKEAAKTELGMTAQAHYKDGVVDGYEAAKKIAMGQ